MAVAKASVSQIKMGEPARAASSSSRVCLGPMTSKSFAFHCSSVMSTSGSAVHLSSVYSRPYSGHSALRSRLRRARHSDGPTVGPPSWSRSTRHPPRRPAWSTRPGWPAPTRATGRRGRVGPRCCCLCVPSSRQSHEPPGELVDIVVAAEHRINVRRRTGRTHAGPHGGDLRRPHPLIGHVTGCVARDTGDPHVRVVFVFLAEPRHPLG